MKPAFALPSLFAAVYFLACTQPHKPVTVTISPAYKKAESFYGTNNDSAFYYFNKAATISKDSLQIAMAYSYMAMIQSDAGDYYGSQESLLTSLKHLHERKETDQNCLLSDFNELGSVSLNLKNYDAAITYYDQALKHIQDSSSQIIALSNKAVAYQKKQQHLQAIAIYDSILHRINGNEKRYARILSNMAFTKWMNDSNYHAAAELWQALHIQENKKDNWGLNASYAHLAGYYFRSRPDSALFYANKMYSVAQVLNSPDDELEALQKMIALNAPGAVKKYFNRYQYLNDSLQTSRNNAKNQFALIRYEVAKSKADNLNLQKENAEKKFQILLQWGVIVIITALAIIIVIWLKKRRQRLLREQQLKTSQKVHDVVANGLYHLMMKVKYEVPDKEMLLDELEELYEQSRNISYDQAEETPVDYPDSVSALLYSFGTEDTNIVITGNEAATWDAVQPTVKNQLQYILKELMVNMKKHSGASNVVIRFERNHHDLYIHYADDGSGLAPGFNYKNGLRNTENRISGIRGSISFDTSAPKGLKIQLSIPIA